MPKNPFIVDPEGSLTLFLAALGEEKIFFTISFNMDGSLGFLSFPRSSKCVVAAKGM